MIKKSKHGHGFMRINYASISHEVETLVLGDGSTRTSAVLHPGDGVTGVSFCEAPGPGPVGQDFIKNGVPTDPNEDPQFVLKNARLQILFDNPDSIDVLIGLLIESKFNLIKQQGGGV